VRVSSAASFHTPVILDYRDATWKLQPTHQVTDTGADVATFSDTRSTNAAPQDVGGDLTLATFNVLNYFNTTGVAYAAAGGSCTFYDDRDGDHVTDKDCGPTGPRGAAEDEDLVRQRDKIVTAINTLDADIVSLEEIENSVALGEADRDDALASLVGALNTAAGSTRWAFAPSPAAADLPPLAEQDVIRTAFIYDPQTVDLVGASKVLTGSAAFGNARQPLAQAFKPHGADAATTFGAIVNHFKSKGSGTDDGTGQGKANPDRVAQAEALAAFADQFTTERGITKLFLTGDFNAYSMEDPIQKLEEKGYTNLQSDTAHEWSYNFSGMAGSLDHVFANGAALGDVTGVDIWDINADESVAFEYSRHNYNATDFYQADQFRASDHDPEIIGIDVPGFPVDATTDESTLQVKATPRRVRVDKTRVKLHIRVRAAEAKPTGTIEVEVGGETYVAELKNGQAQVRLPRFDSPGSKAVTVTYLGDDETQGSSTTVEIKVEPRPGHGNGRRTRS
jgi:predicted extracellular nuclease